MYTNNEQKEFKKINLKDLDFNALCKGLSIGALTKLIDIAQRQRNYKSQNQSNFNNVENNNAKNVMESISDNNSIDKLSELGL